MPWGTDTQQRRCFHAEPPGAQRREDASEGGEISGLLTTDISTGESSTPAALSDKQASRANHIRPLAPLAIRHQVVDPPDSTFSPTPLFPSRFTGSIKLSVIGLKESVKWKHIWTRKPRNAVVVLFDMHRIAAKVVVRARADERWKPHHLHLANTVPAKGAKL